MHARETHPGLSRLPWGSVVLTTRCRSTFTCRTRYRSLELAVDSETVRAVRTPRHRHHPPRIKNCQSESYAEIGRDRLCTRLSSVVRQFGLLFFASARAARRAGAVCLGVNRCCRANRDNIHFLHAQLLGHLSEVSGHQCAEYASKRTRRRDLRRLPQPRPQHICPMSSRSP